jgi:hypothetical protein
MKMKKKNTEDEYHVDNDEEYQDAEEDDDE